MDPLDVATKWATILGAVVAAIAAGAAIWLAILALRQLRETLEARYDEHRTVFVPSGEFLADQSVNYDPAASLIAIGCKSQGPGLALSVRAVLFPPGPNPDRPQDNDPRWHSTKAYLPWESQEAEVLELKEGGLLVRGTDKIGGCLLCPPHPLEFQRQGKSHVACRLTITCRDIFGRKHLSMYDRTVERVWEPVALLANVKDDLIDLSQRNVLQIPRGGDTGQTEAAPSFPSGMRSM